MFALVALNEEAFCIFCRQSCSSDAKTAWHRTPISTGAFGAKPVLSMLEAGKGWMCCGKKDKSGFGREKTPGLSVEEAVVKVYRNARIR